MENRRKHIQHNAPFVGQNRQKPPQTAERHPRIPHTHLSKQGPCRDNMKASASSHLPQKATSPTRNSEHATPTSSQTIIEATHTLEATRSQMKIRARTQPPATRRCCSDSNEELRRKNQAGRRQERLPNGTLVASHHTSPRPNHSSFDFSATKKSRQSHLLLCQ